MSASNYSIWVLEYAISEEYPVSGVLYGEHNQGFIHLPYAYVVMKSADRVVMVDVGYKYEKYGKTLADRFSVINWRDPRTVLGEVGIAPTDVTDVIVTHAHFDHFGNIEDFPRATFHIQEEEFAKWAWALTLPSEFAWLQKALNPDDIVTAARLAAEGRLKFVQGDRAEILPGIDVWAAHDSHTFGSQFVVVNNDGGSDPWVLAGDLRYVFENVTGIDNSGNYVPVGLASGSQLNLLRATDHMMNLVARDHMRIVPVHEDRLSTVFPSRVSGEGLRIVEITLAKSDSTRV